MNNDQQGHQTAVLIHGLSETREAWAHQLPFLRQSREAIAYDIRGFGRSPVGSGDGTVEQMADDLAQLVSACSHGPAWLVGFSMGGVIAQRFALDFPEMTAGLVLIASSCTVGQSGQAFFHSRIKNVTDDGLEAIAAITATDARGCFALGDEQLINEYQELRTAAVRDTNGYLNACRAMLRLGDNPMTEELAGIACPTLVIAAEHDPYCPPRASEMIARAIPAAQFKVIAEAGHCMHWEASTKTNHLIGAFIDEHEYKQVKQA